MIDQSAALERLYKDRAYEDKLVSDLSEYFLDCINSIPDLTDTEKEKIRINLERIYEDSKIHLTLFTKLIDLVFENADDKY
jgi:hypothetical protein